MLNIFFAVIYCVNKLSKQQVVLRVLIFKKKFKQFLIPLPPLSVQRRIVEILDKFTTLEAELEAVDLLKSQEIDLDYTR